MPNERVNAFNALKRETTTIARQRGHLMGGWRTSALDDSADQFVADALCQVCGMMAFVIDRPRPNEIAQGGEAVALTCPKRQRYIDPAPEHRLPMVPASSPNVSIEFFNTGKNVRVAIFTTASDSIIEATQDAESEFNRWMKDMGDSISIVDTMVNHTTTNAYTPALPDEHLHYTMIITVLYRSNSVV